MKTLAIVSSYSESCGNAAFTRILHDSIEMYSNIKVEVIELNLKLLQSIDRKTRHLAKNHIKNICQQLKNFDAVNLQMEAGLYGTLPHDIIKRVKCLMLANPNTSLTLHSPRLISTSSACIRSGLKKLLSLRVRAGLGEIIAYSTSRIHTNINKRIILQAVKQQHRLIVHTLRAKQQIQENFNYNNTDVHPLKIVPENFQIDVSISNKIRNQLNLSSTDVLIGMFGYISSYKGHTDALRAMKSLPKNYKLLIFGRQHPQTLKTDGSIDYYLSLLINTIESNQALLGSRVFFLGELSDQDFLQVAGNVDIAWLPYYENGQDGSGIASICLDVCKKVLCSTSFAFDELFKLIPYPNTVRFDIGNALEMATKTKILNMDESPTLEADLNKYTVRTQARIYLKDFPPNCLN